MDAVATGTASIIAASLGPARLDVRLRRNAAKAGDDVTLGFRPEHVAIGTEGNSFNGKVRVVEQLGSVSYIYADAEGGAPVTIEQRRLSPLKAAEPLAFSLEPQQLFLFDKDGERL